MAVIGKGTPSYTFTRTPGLVRWFREPQDVIESLDTDLESTVALVASGGTTFLSPILGRLAGSSASTGRCARTWRSSPASSRSPASSARTSPRT